MQTIKYLEKWLRKYSNNQHYLFTFNDLCGLLPGSSVSAVKTLLSRAVKAGILHRVCKGIYIYSDALPNDGLLLFHVAALLRANHFNYISLETALSDAGVISQILVNHITLMSSGRSNIIACGAYGNIEFIHTDKKPSELYNDLFYDNACGLWRAKIALAIKDMRRTNRDLDLIDWNIVDEFI